MPIGSARDITLRALDVLASADVLAAEDTRSLRKLLEIHGVPLDGRRILSLHDHSGEKSISSIAQAIEDGRSVAYASEAGMPLIADPGFELVRLLAERGLPVTSVPGPSAVPTALAIAGLPTDAFLFGGFLPSSKSARRKALSNLKDVQATLVLFESPKRLATSLSDAADMLGADRPAAICRELTKKFEEVLRGTLSELSQLASQRALKGEIVLVISRGDKAAQVSEELVETALSEALETMSVKDAAADVASKFNLKKRDVYQQALGLSKS